MKLVFCALVLLHLQLAEGGGKIEYKSIFDIYGESLENLQPGDVLMRDDSDLVLIYNKQQYFQVGSGERIYPEDRDVLCGFLKYPANRQAESQMGRLMKVESVSDKKVTFALVDRLAGRWLPYHPDNCGKRDWMRYICYGEVKQSSFRDCPLEASLEGVDERQIKDGTFKLRDGNSRDIKEFPSLNDRWYTRKCQGAFWFLKLKRLRRSRVEKQRRKYASVGTFPLKSKSSDYSSESNAGEKSLKKFQSFS